jgi:hypothetical protein
MNRMGEWAGVRAAAWCVLAMAVGCSGSSKTDAASCGSGTHLEDGKCVPTVACGPGTQLVSGACLPVSDAGGVLGEVQCGLGTQLLGHECVSASSGGAAENGGDGATAGEPSTAGTDAGAIGAGATTFGGSTGQGDSAGQGGGSAITCGSGTMLVGSVCLPDSGGGSAGDGGLPSYIVRVGVTTVGADGYSAIPVFVIGTNPNYDAANDNVVLGLQRPGAGSLSVTALKPGPSGTTLYFVPCSSASNSFCAGTQQITLASAASPTQVIAESQTFTLVAPQGIGSDSPCQGGGNTLFFNGDAGSYIYSGIETVTLGAWSASATSSEVHISVDPTDSTQGLWWDLYFDASKLADPTLTTQVYEDAERWPFQDAGHPGFDVSGDGRGCNTVSGSFEIEDLQMSNGTLQSFTATFEHHCEGAAPALRGCVHFSQ